MKKTILIITFFLLQGCGLIDQTTTITMPDGETTYRVVTKQDGKVKFNDGTVNIDVDNSGRPGLIEQAIGAALITLPDKIEVTR